MTRICISSSPCYIHRSSATDDFLDLEIPTEASTSTSSSTVAAVTITDPWAAAAVTEETTTTTAATSSTATTADTTTATTEQTTASEAREVEAVCRRYNACVVYLASEADTELDIADIRAVAEAGAASRRAGLSVGTAVARLEAGAGLPRNPIATLTVEAASPGSLSVPRETHNYDLSAISRAAEDDSLALRSAAAAVAGTAARLGWGGVAVVVQGSGATQQLAELLVLHPGLCVQVYLELYVDISSIYFIYSLFLARDPPGP